MIYGLPQNEARWVKSQVNRTDHPQTRTRDTREALPVSQAAIALTDGSGISARSGTTAGSGTVTLYYLSGSTLTEFANNNGDPVTVTAYNLSKSAVAPSAYIHVKREFLSGQWLVDYEDCG